MKTIIHLWYPFLRMRNVSDKSSRENKKHILCSITFFILKYCIARQATDDSMAHVHCMLDT